VKVLLDDAYRTAKKTLMAHREQLEKVAAELLKKETLDAHEFYTLIGKEIPSVRGTTFPFAQLPTTGA
ncbi:MAG TPA: hypothetical protein VIT23_02635, partial [Terrimicrobiaceae bacterium]